jgi:mono/diheme cytochrome c family protein
MGVLTYKGATARESLGSEAVGAIDTWSQTQGGFSEEARAGAEIFAQVGCLQCHTYLGSGSSNLGAPDLSRIGQQQNADFLRRYVANPREFGNNVMPVYGETLSDEQLAQVAAFLEASKNG